MGRRRRVRQALVCAVELDGDDVSGIAVAIGARVGAVAEPSEVLISQMIKDLTTGSGIIFTARGGHQLKGVPDAWRLTGPPASHATAQQVDRVAFEHDLMVVDEESLKPLSDAYMRRATDRYSAR